MKLWKVILAVIVIFGAGVVTGSLVVKIRGPGGNRSMAGPFPGGPPGRAVWGQSRAQFVQRMNRELGLTTDQRREIERIMKESHQRMAKLWEPIAPQAQEETARVREQIRAALAPGQRARFEEVCKENRQHDAHEARERRERWERDNSESDETLPRKSSTKTNEVVPPKTSL